MARSPAERPSPSQATPRGSGTAFSLFGIPVRVTPSFWIIAVLFGISGGGGSASAASTLAYAAIWTAIVFISIVLHELGHALTALAFGAKPAITLHAMGGLTHFDGGKMSRAESWLISFAGPAVGLIVGFLLRMATRSHPLGAEGASIVRSILWVNIGWSLINLLPVVPFDGGHMMAAMLGPRRALSTAVISAVVGAGAAAAGFVYLGSPWIAVLFGSATVGAVRQARRIWLFGADSKQGLDAELGRARAAVARGDANVALAVAEEVLGRARTSPMRNGAVLALAWAQATLGRPLVARELLERLERDGPVDAFLLAAVEDALGSPEAARARLEAAHREGVKDADATKLLIDLYAREGKLTRAIEVAMQELEVLGREAAAAVLSEAMARGAYAPAVDLAARMFEVFGDPADAVAGARAAALAGKRAPR